MIKRGFRFNVRITYDELDRLKSRVKKVGLDKSTFVRGLIAGYEAREKSRS